MRSTLLAFSFFLTLVASAVYGQTNTYNTLDKAFYPTTYGVNGQCWVSGGNGVLPNWASCGAGGGNFTSLSGDGSLIINSGSTGTVVLAVGNAGAHKYWGNNTGSSTPASFVQPACGDLSNSAASCSTDATVATNITSGTLPGARMPALGGDITSVANSTSITVTKTNGVAFVASATSDTTNAANIISGTLPGARMPALGGDVTSSANSTTTTIAANAVTSGKFRQSASNSLVGNATGSTATVTDVPVPGCTDVGGNHLNWTSGTGFSCGNTSSGGGGSALSSLTAATTPNTIASGNNTGQVWNWANTSNNTTAMTFGETSAATGGTSSQGVPNQVLLRVSVSTNTTQGAFRVDVGSRPMLFVPSTPGYIQVGDLQQLSNSTPMYISVGGNLSSTPLGGMKLRIWDSGSDAGSIGIGAAAAPGDAGAGLNINMSDSTAARSFLIGTGGREMLRLGSGNGVTATYLRVHENSSDTTGFAVQLRKSRGTVTAPTVITTGDALYTESGFGYVGSTNTYAEAARMEVDSTGTISDSPTGIAGIISLQTRNTGEALSEKLNLGPVNVTVTAASPTTATAGGTVTIAGGNATPSNSLAGGTITLQAGNASQGTSTAGVGGSVNLTAGIGFRSNTPSTAGGIGATVQLNGGGGGQAAGTTSVAGKGGPVIIFGGAAGTGTTTTGAGGAITILGGTPDTTGVGGALLVRGGPSGSSGGTGGNTVLQGGLAQANANGNGGNVQVLGGNASTGANTSGTAGLANLQGGGGFTSNTPSTTGGIGGGAFVTGGAGGGASGSTSAGGTGGQISISGGAAGAGTTTTATGGAIFISGGSPDTTGVGGNITITSGVGGSTSGNSGNLVLASGTVTSGTPGTISLSPNSSPAMVLDNLGHISYRAGGTQSAAPTITAGCGSTPTITGNDNVFVLNVGTGGSATSCTVTFNKAWTTTPHCFANDQTSQAITTTLAPSTSTVVATATAAWSASSKIDVMCIGHAS